MAEQAKPALLADDFKKQAGKLSDTQKGLNERVDKLGSKIRELPDGETEFAYEIGLLAKVSEVMGEATGILGSTRDGGSGDRGRDRGHRAALTVEAHQPQGGRRRGFDPWRRRPWQDARFGTRPLRRRCQREGSA